MKRAVLSIIFLATTLFISAQSQEKYQIKFLEVNEQNSDYAVAMLEDNKVIFTSAVSDTDFRKKNWNYRKDLFVGDIGSDGELKNTKPVYTNINSKYNTTGVAYSKDLKTVYFSRNKYVKSRSRQRSDKYQKYEILRADVAQNGEWKNIEKLPFNSDKYSVSYPTLSADGTKLYFVSDMLPSMGKADIFVVDISTDGTIGKPRNLGKNVNTPGNETTPFVSDDNVLYFSSDGHPGKGKLDVFAVDLLENSTSETRTLESPINTINDDFAYVINKETNMGYFTSNRLQGKDNFDLYSFTLEEDQLAKDCYITVEGLVKDKESSELLPGATVDLLDLNGGLIESMATSTDGFYQFQVPCDKEYKLAASNNNYKGIERHIEILEQNYHRTLHANLDLNKINNEVNIAEAEEEKVELLSIEAIHFEFDRSDIRQEDKPELDKVARMMLDNPNIKIQAHAYTDSRGSHAYNKALSDRRAKSTVDYLVSQGVERSRIEANGNGEEKLVNHCVNGVDCSEAAHEMNRRTEFIIINNPINNKKPDSKSSNQIKVTTISNQSAKAKKQVKPKPVEEVPKPIPKITETENEIAYQEPKEEQININKEEETIVSENVKEEEIIKNDENDSTINEQIANNKIENNIVDQELKEEQINVNKEEEIVQNKESQSVNKEQNINNTENDIAEQEELKEDKIVQNIERKPIRRERRTDNKAVNYIIDQKEEVINNLANLEEKYEDEIVSNPNNSKALKAEKMKVSTLKKEVEENSEAGWNEIIAYKSQILSLNRTYKRLTVHSNVERKTSENKLDKRQIPNNDQESVSEIKIIEEPKEAPKQLKVDNVNVVAMKKNYNGKFSETNSATRTDMIKVSFKLKKDTKIAAGEKNAYVVVKSPNGSVSNAKGVFTMKNSREMKKFTDHTVINYDNHDVNVVMFVKNKSKKMEKGVYPVELFVDGQLAGNSLLSVR
ncbi:MAG: OmpA family protein [Bacteroidota bacterium]